MIPHAITYAEAEALNEPDTNPRWIACHAALGRQPKTWEFTSWNDKHWHLFLTSDGVKPDRYASFPVAYSMAKGVSIEAAQEAYDTWLKENLT